MEISLEEMSQELPQLKATWANGGSTAAFLEGLRALTIRGRTLSIARYEPVCFQPWPAST